MRVNLWPKSKSISFVKSILYGLVLVVGAMTALTNDMARADDATATKLSYDRDIRPILAEHCFACHGFDDQAREADLRLDNRQAALDAGAIVPGDASKSQLYQRVTTEEHDQLMPPEHTGKKLSAKQKSILQRWIQEGADYQKHWAFERPVRTEPPRTRPDQNPIDGFVQKKLSEANLKPSPTATPETLIRRASLDITGLPPTTQQIDAFLAESQANSQDAYRKLVDSLLASPHYGERLGRWWLDQARYGDSNGYSIDAPRQIWLYRDWVINALNKDMPFDQFTIEQLAGDLLPNATQDQKIATGFHRNTQINQEGGVDPEQFRIDSVFDRVATTGTVWLGLTIGCAQCHNHKYDPITQEEYYQIFAFLNNQDEPELKIESSEGEGKPISTMVMKERDKPRETHLFIKGDFTRQSQKVTPGTPSVLHPLKAVLAESSAPLIPPAAGDSTDGQCQEDGPNKEAKKDANDEAKDKAKDKSKDETSEPMQPSLNRLDLARWIVDRDNPLVARVIVNRIWQHYFGRGLVESENDFGLQSTLPSHPELLDWLAVEFMESGWSLKHLQRLIVTSETYRQSSKRTAELDQADPYNLLLARQQRLRLEAEIVRDVSLQASGLLAPKFGGPPVYPPIPDGVMNQGQVKRDWKTSQGDDRYRRGVYTFVFRATPPPSLNVFDAPDGFSSCTRRIRSNTPLQALTLMNDAGFFEFAQALEKIIQQQGLAEAFRRCTSRKPTASELAILEKLDTLNAARALLNLDETISRE